MEANKILEMIAAAFPLLPFPEMSVHQAQLADQSMSREIPKREWEDARKLDENKTWRDYSDDELMTCDAALAHLEESSFVYYLPAYLSFGVRHCGVSWPAPEESLLGSVVFAVTHRTPYTLGRFKRLSPQQREAVVAFLELVSEKGNDHERPQAQKALTRYWKAEFKGPSSFIFGKGRIET
ncbi:MAG: DUF6714 family protein [Gammaproteobacteria bacterium]